MLRRREFMRYGVLATVAGLAGCGQRFSSPVLAGALDTLPKEVFNALPPPWRFKPLKNYQPFSDLLRSNPDLIALSDGWLSALPEQSLQPIDEGNNTSLIGPKAKDFMGMLGPKISKNVFPLGSSPWVMLFRNGETWLQEAMGTWQVLLAPELKNRLVLPESPRIVMSLASHMSAPNALKRLRMQAVTFDDRNSVNWLLSGKAKVVVLPLFRCMRLLARDPRLSVALPRTGYPLNWSLLVRPNSSRYPFPKSWINEIWSMPLLGQLLGTGWIPALPRSRLLRGLSMVPKKYQSIVLPDEQVWNRSWSLPLLDNNEQIRLKNQWNESTP